MDTDKLYASFADNPLLFEAIHTFLKKEFDSDASMNSSMPNELLGQKTRARLDGIATVEAAFRKLANYRTIKSNQQEKNPAR